MNISNIGRQSYYRRTNRIAIQDNGKGNKTSFSQMTPSSQFWFLSMQSYNRGQTLRLNNLSDYKYLPTKIKPPMSDEEFKQKMIEQAQSDVKQGVYMGSEARSIQNVYMQVGSPDRVGAIKSQFNSLFSSPVFGNARVQNMDIYSGSAHTAMYNPQYGWEGIITPEESKRTADILNVYRDAYKEACGGDINAYVEKHCRTQRTYSRLV